MSEEIKTQETVTEPVVQEETTQEVKEEVKAPSKNQILREMSKEYGVNLFEPEGLKAFKEYQESQKTEAEKRAEELKSLNERLKKYETESKDKDFNLAALELGIPKEKIKEAKALSQLDTISGETIQERLADMKTKYSTMFQNQNTKESIEISIGTQMSEKENETSRIKDEALARYEERKKSKF